MKSCLYNILVLAFVSLASAIKIDFSEKDLIFKSVHEKEPVSVFEARLLETMRHCHPDDIKNIVRKDNVKNVLLPRYGWRPIHAAAAYCSPETMQLFLSAGVDINTQATEGETPLMVAILYNNAKTKAFLYYNKASRKDLLTVNNWGILHFAAAASSGSFLGAVLEHNPEIEIDPQGGDRGITPLMIAIMTRNYPAVDILLKNGASELVTDNEGINALLLAQMAASHSPIGDISQVILLAIEYEFKTRQNKNYFAHVRARTALDHVQQNA